MKKGNSKTKRNRTSCTKAISIFLNPCPKFNLIRCLSYKSNYNNNNDDDDDDDKATTGLKMETSLKTKVAVLSWPVSGQC